MTRTAPSSKRKRSTGILASKQGKKRKRKKVSDAMSGQAGIQLWLHHIKKEGTNKYTIYLLYNLINKKDSMIRFNVYYLYNLSKDNRF